MPVRPLPMSENKARLVKKTGCRKHRTVPENTMGQLSIDRFPEVTKNRLHILSRAHKPLRKCDKMNLMTGGAFLYG